jgi:hypothetical protein
MMADQDVESNMPRRRMAVNLGHRTSESPQLGWGMAVALPVALGRRSFGAAGLGATARRKKSEAKLQAIKWAESAGFSSTPTGKGLIVDFSQC